jgi:hypothetical protein
VLALLVEQGFRGVACAQQHANPQALLSWLANRAEPLLRAVSVTGYGAPFLLQTPRYLTVGEDGRIDVARGEPAADSRSLWPIF